MSFSRRFVLSDRHEVRVRVKGEERELSVDAETILGFILSFQDVTSAKTMSPSSSSLASGTQTLLAKSTLVSQGAEAASLYRTIPMHPL
jgi:hypothetical protein